MKKYFLCLITVLIFAMQACSGVFAQNTYLSNKLKSAISKYKRGNYTGCLQDCQAIVKQDPKNAFAYYYMGMSYVQAGKKDEAIKAYSKVLGLKPSTKLAEYASTGKRCLETPEMCNLETSTPENSTEIDKFIASPSYDGLSDSVRKDFQQKHLDKIKHEINKDQELDDYDFQRFEDRSSSVEDVSAGVKVAQNKPTDEEIKAALKVLNDAGINVPNAASNNVQAQAMQQNPDLAQLNALFGGNNQSMDNDNMINMLPYMMAQSKDGSTNYSPQMMQAVIMNSMMKNFNFDLKD